MGEKKTLVTGGKVLDALKKYAENPHKHLNSHPNPNNL